MIAILTGSTIILLASTCLFLCWWLEEREAGVRSMARQAKQMNRLFDENVKFRKRLRVIMGEVRKADAALENLSLLGADGLAEDFTGEEPKYDMNVVFSPATNQCDLKFCPDPEPIGKKPENDPGPETPFWDDGQ